MNDSPEQNGFKERISLHERLTALEVQMNTILTNHLPHLQVAIDSLNTKFWAIIILLISNLVAIIIKFKF